MNFKIMTLLVLLWAGLATNVFSQSEVTAWGNMKGIRVEGQLMEFGTSLRLVGEDWSEVRKTAKEQQLPAYRREGKKQIVTTRFDSLYIRETIEDKEPGVATAEVQFTAKADTTIAGAYFTIELPAKYYSGATLKLKGQPDISLEDRNLNLQQEYLNTITSSISFVSPERSLEVQMEDPTKVIIRKDPASGENQIQVYFEVLGGRIEEGQTARKTFTIKATGTIDKEPLTLHMNTSRTGRPFAGLGGNFRLQNPDTDPQVINYSLENLRVAWGRVEMPWRFWHPDENMDPSKATKGGDLHPKVHAAMEMAQTLSKKGIPVILSNWSAPDWAIVGPYTPRPVNGIWGNPLNEEKMEEIYKSITAYILYMKKNYGVETEMFSFNESDLGINVRQTEEEHARLIKGLGAYFKKAGLKTKLLLGDNSDANTYAFIYPAMEDKETHPYIGAVSFHSWRGWADTTLQKWDAAAKKLNVPLIVGEGSIDAAAWRYPAIFEEPIYAMEEINLYTRILAICEPLTILQWQLTADYSPMAGGGIFGNNEPLRPLRRFWNLKQLASTPEGLYAMPVQVSKKNVTAAGLGDNKKGVYAVHLVNNEPSRQATLRGLPAKVKQLRMYVTDDTREMQELDPVKVSGGKAVFNIDAVSYVTLISGKQRDR